MQVVSVILIQMMNNTVREQTKIPEYGQIRASVKHVNKPLSAGQSQICYL